MKQKSNIKPVRCKKCNKFVSRDRSYVEIINKKFVYTHPKCYGNILKKIVYYLKIYFLR